MAIPHGWLHAVCSRWQKPCNWACQTSLPSRTLDSSISQPRFRRNDERTTVKHQQCHGFRFVCPLALAGALLLLLAACNGIVHYEAPPFTPTTAPEVHLLATATAVAPTAPEMRARLAQECRHYGNCDGPPHWDALVLALEQRPLQLPALEPDAACPEPFIRSVAGYDFQVIGEGPAYSLFYLLTVSVNGNVDRAHDGWHWNKVVWARDPQYTGPIVIRGRQLNGPATLRFQWMKDGNPSPELAHASLHVPPYSPGISRLTDGSGRWEEMMTWAVVRAPGCYGVQIDGIDFSNVIVFRVHGK